MNPILSSALCMGLDMMRNAKAGQKRMKEEVLEEWVKSANYPRKKKKHVRKRLQLKWNIACWDPMGLNDMPDL